MVPKCFNVFISKLYSGPSYVRDNSLKVHISFYLYAMYMLTAH